MDTSTQNFALLHQPFERPDAYHSLAMPVYHSVAFEFDTAEEMAAVFRGQSAGHAYARITNPTVQYFEKRIQAAKHALSVTALNTGMSAISSTLISIAGAGTNIVTSRHLFGNTVSLLKDTLEPFGVEIRFCDLTHPEEVRAAIDEHTCALFLEIITNPQLEVADLSALGAIGKELGVPLVADTTVIPFTAFDAKALGVNIEVFSSTKYLSGGGTSLGGVVIDYGTFAWKRSHILAQRAQRYGAFAFTSRLKGEVYRNLGCYMTPQVAYMQTLGLETVNLRFERQASTCLELARRLRQEPGIVTVNYPGLEDNPFHELSVRQFGPLPGAVLTFDLESGAACYRFLNRLKLIRRATNLFENKSLAIHPASTIFGTFTPDQLSEMNVCDRTIRLSVGLDDADALLADIRQALAAE
jgi:O-acetylhomoserine (thiol)-lyase